MTEEQQILEDNKKNYKEKYESEKEFLMYPSDWIIRFHNLYLKKNKPSGRIFDYGCGSGNNSIFFVEKGYEVFGVDVVPRVQEMVRKSLKSKHLDENLAKNFAVVDPSWENLAFEDNSFDIILSNQVLYYLSSEENIKRTCKEFFRCLRPGGIVYFTMMGPKNYYITEWTKNIHGNVHEIHIDDPKHRLYGLKEMIYLVRDEEELKDLFSEFECINVGYLEHSMFDLLNTQHWIFTGKKPE